MKKDQHIVRFLLFSWSMLAVWSLNAQFEAPGFERIIIESDGMETGRVTDITEDLQGYLWFTTADGLARYDGYQFKIYQEAEGDSTSLISNNVESLYVDHLGDIWIGTVRGVCRYHPPCDCFQRYPDQPGHRTPTGFVTDITEDLDMNLWFLIQEGGLFRYQRETGQFTRFLDHPNDPSTIIHDMTRVLLADRHNRIWIGTGFGSPETGTGLIRFDPSTGVTKRFLHDPTNQRSLLDNRISSLFQDRDGRIMIGTYQNGLHLYDPVQENFSRLPSGGEYPHRLEPPKSTGKVWMNDPFVNIIQQDHKGNYWIGTLGVGINHLDVTSNDLTFYAVDPSSPKGITTDKIWSLHEDSQGHIWVGDVGGKGLHKLDPWAATFVQDEQMWGVDVASLCAHSKEREKVWVGTEGDGLFLLDLSGNKRNLQKVDIGVGNGLADLAINHVFQDRDGILWVGRRLGKAQGSESDKDNLIRYDPDTKVAKAYSVIVEDSFQTTHPQIYHISEDAQGYLWLSMGGDGLIRFDPESETYSSYKVNRSGDLVNQADVYITYVDSEADVWVANTSDGGGLYKYEYVNDRFVPSIDGYRFKSLFEDGEGWYWGITYDQGVVHFHPKNDQYRVYDGGDGLRTSELSSILPDSDGSFWLGTNRGLFYYSSTSDRFTSKGLVSYEFTTGASITVDGHLFFGTNKGLISFDPEAVGGNPFPPKIALTDVQISGIRYTGDKSMPIDLSHDQNELNIGYVGLHYGNPSKITYRYKLTPFDKEWIYAGTGRSARYTNLDPGTYTFSVMAANPDGLWTKDAQSIQFYIQSAWWLRWWAILVYLVIAGLCLYTFYRFQLSRRLANSERERLEELHQLKSQLYTNITHEFRTPLTVILGMAEMLKTKSPPSGDNQNSLTLIQRNGENLLHLINEMLDLAKLESGNMTLSLGQSDVVAFVRYNCESFHSLAQISKINLVVYDEIDHLVMDFDPDKLCIIVSNLLSNAIKFSSKGQKIIVHLYRSTSDEGPLFHIKVKDHGRGIADNEIPKVFDRFYQAESSSRRSAEGSGIGLALAQELVRLMKGNISVKSTLGKGTEFVIQIPITNQAPEHNSEVTLTRNQSLHPTLSETKVRPKAVKAVDLPVVLLIEDNLDIVHYLYDCLENTYQLIHAKDGMVGLEIAYEKVPDIIVCDVMMPTLDGFEVCSRIKSDLRTDHIPIIMLTARITLNDRLTGLVKGADAYLNKPFNRAELLLWLDNLLAVRQNLQKKYSTSMQTTTPPSPILQSKAESFLRRMEEVILAHLGSEDFSVHELASSLNLSRSQLHRKIKALTNMSTTIYIRQVRLNLAKQLVTEGDLPISEIAYQVGFKSPVYFSQVFKDTFGESPTATRAAAEETS